MSWLRKILAKRRYEVESFRASLDMQTEERRKTRARLRAIEIKMKNEGRLK